MTPFTDQAAYDVRLEWGAAGLKALAAAGVDVVVIIDVLSFTNCVAVAVDRGASVLPYPSAAEGAAAYTSAHNAELAGHRGDRNARYSLSPASLSSVPPQTRLVLPSPNGSELSFGALDGSAVIAGCLRNRTAVAAYLNDHPWACGVRGCWRAMARPVTSAVSRGPSRCRCHRFSPWRATLTRGPGCRRGLRWSRSRHGSRADRVQFGERVNRDGLPE